MWRHLIFIIVFTLKNTASVSTILKHNFSDVVESVRIILYKQSETSHPIEPIIKRITQTQGQTTRLPLAKTLDILIFSRQVCNKKRSL